MKIYCIEIRKKDKKKSTIDRIFSSLELAESYCISLIENDNSSLYDYSIIEWELDTINKKRIRLYL